jgi:hypothetical protein
MLQALSKNSATLTPDSANHGVVASIFNLNEANLNQVSSEALGNLATVG